MGLLQRINKLVCNIDYFVSMTSLRSYVLGTLYAILLIFHNCHAINLVGRNVRLKAVATPLCWCYSVTLQRPYLVNFHTFTVVGEKVISDSYLLVYFLYEVTIFYENRKPEKNHLK